MRLVRAQVTSYKSITDSGWFAIEPGVTCLVGKNESGKTALLEALYRLKPLSTGHSTRFEELRDYPRRYRARDRNELKTKRVIHTEWTLDDADIAAVEGRFGEGALASRSVTVSKGYENVTYWSIPFNYESALRHLLTAAGLDAAKAAGATSEAALIQALEGDDSPAAAPFVADLRKRDLSQEAINLLSTRAPAFHYFNEYNTVAGRLSITRLQQTDENKLEPEERTALALLRLAGVASEEFTEADYEPRRAALEAAANQLSDEVFQYWSQNRELRVELDVEFVREEPRAAAPPEPYLQVRIRNDRHRISLNVGDRSSGFISFFSFLAAFAEYRERREPVILLLDEPGMGLHATAQADLLRYIDEQLSPHGQVIYTTHSPFMVDPTRPSRARAVEDVEPDAGTKVFHDATGTTRDTAFPLQAALGYELAQTLFVGPNALLVEGPADYIYLQVMSDLLRSHKREGLDERWVVTPAGGVDRVPTFISLAGTQLNVVTLLDGASGGSEKINDLAERGLLDGHRLVPLANYAGTAEPSVEDLFDEDFYIELVNASGVGKVPKAKLPPPNGVAVTRRIRQAIGDFSRYRPAAHLLREQASLVPRIDEATLDRFERLFHDINALVESGGSR